ncbi:hypothetical protein C8J57DRAFT_1234133 [Mycena rebaudengoi]|nr:hypothetical protein C8J57DRAFT_1234133 [Mycena rebaudengoi]
MPLQKAVRKFDVYELVVSQVICFGFRLPKSQVNLALALVPKPKIRQDLEYHIFKAPVRFGVLFDESDHNITSEICEKGPWQDHDGQDFIQLRLNAARSSVIVEICDVSQRKQPTQDFEPHPEAEKPHSSTGTNSINHQSALTLMFPPEMWDLILRKLDEYSLFTAGGVCRAFNSRFTAIYLERKAISSESLVAGALNIESYCLLALLLPTSTPQLKLSPSPSAALSCQFPFTRGTPTVLSLRRRHDRRPEVGGSSILEGDHSHGDEYMIGNWGAFGRGGSPGSFGFITEVEDEEKKIRVVGSANLVWGPLWSRRSAPAHSAANPTSLGRSNSSTFPPWEASPSTIPTVLSHITLPVLQHLHIHEQLDPTALGAFLRRHLHITSINDEASGTSMLLDAPATLPLLTNISCSRSSPIRLLLDVVEPEAEALPWPLMDNVMGGLHGVDWVHVRCGTIGAARRLVPWFAMLPALQRVDFEFTKAVRRRAARAFVQEMRAALAGVPNISLRSDQRCTGAFSVLAYCP